MKYNLAKQLDLKKVSQLDVETKRRRQLYNRIKLFERQSSKHYQEKGYYPALAQMEIKRLRTLETIMHNDLIVNNIKSNKLKSINKEIDQWTY